MDLFKLVLDSQKMDGWNDSLGKMIDAVDVKYKGTQLSDDDLMLVAGGKQGYGAQSLGMNASEDE